MSHPRTISRPSSFEKRAGRCSPALQIATPARTFPGVFPCADHAGQCESQRKHDTEERRSYHRKQESDQEPDPVPILAAQRQLPKESHFPKDQSAVQDEPHRASTDARHLQFR